MTPRAPRLSPFIRFLRFIGRAVDVFLSKNRGFIGFITKEANLFENRDSQAKTGGVIDQSAVYSVMQGIMLLNQKRRIGPLLWNN